MGIFKALERQAHAKAQAQAQAQAPPQQQAQAQVPAPRQQQELYRPLTGNDIRLLTILPVDSKPLVGKSLDGTVRCTLAHYPLHEPSNSTALRDCLNAREDAWSASSRPLGVSIAGSSSSDSGQFRTASKFGKLHLSLARRMQAEGRYAWGDYVALSYTWGDPKITREICVNGRSMQVTTNLEAGLRVLRDKAPIKAGLKIWVDAICLNQQDIPEKDVQLKRMRDIYRQALEVVIWLGNSYQDSDRAMRLILLLSASVKDDDGEALQEYLNDDQNYIGHILPPDAEPLVGCWHALQRLMQNQYWDRAWIVQELFFSRSTSPVLCGNDYVDLGQLSDATTKWITPNSLAVVRRQVYGERLLLAAEGRPINSLGNAPRTGLEKVAAKYGGIMFDPQVRQIKGVTEASDVQNWSIDSERLNFIGRLKFSLGNKCDAHPANLIALGRTSEATNARDKIFAFTGLMDAAFVEQIDAGYSSSVEGVYTAFSIAWMRNSGLLDLLTHCRLEDYPADYNGPTWVPNWQNKKSLPLLLIGDVPNPYCAGGPGGGHLISSDRSILSVAGFIVGTIDALSATEDETPAQIMQSRQASNVYHNHNNDQLRDALWRTFLGNRHLDFKIPDAGIEDWRPLLDIPLPQRGGHLPAPFDKSFYEFVEINADFKIYSKPLTTYFANNGRREPVATDAASVRMFKKALLASVQRAMIMTHRRRLMTTMNGNVGLVPRAARQGDKIAVVLGCSEPLVLRRVLMQGQERWKVVGSCYVHGFMEGEIFQAVEARTVQLTKLHFC